MSEISITRALAEIKSLDDRITKATGQALYIAVTKGQGDRKTVHGNATSVAAVEEGIRANFARINDLIRRRKQIKSRIIASNAATTVVIGKQTMTVAEAIERKQSINLETGFHVAMRQQLLNATKTVDVLTTKLNEDIEKGITAAFGSDKTKVTPELYNSVADPRRKEFEPALLDPLNLTKCLDDMAATLQQFIDEVDFVLSESNALTKIAVDD